LEAGRRVGDALADERGDRPGEDADPDPARPRRAVPRASGEARADGDVGLAGKHRLEDRSELPRVVLAVAVEAHGEIEVVLERVAEAGLDGSADPEVEREPDHLRPSGAGDLRGPVGGAVVDHDDLEARVERTDL